MRADRAAMQDAGRMTTEHYRAGGDESCGGGNGCPAPSGFGDIDPMEAARAGSAAQAIHAYYAGLISALYADRSLTPEQRKSAIATLRAKAKAEAAGVSRQIMEQAKGAAKIRQAMLRQQRGRPRRGG